MTKSLKEESSWIFSFVSNLLSQKATKNHEPRIEYYLETLYQKGKEIPQLYESELQNTTSCFILFNSALGAHTASKALISHNSYEFKTKANILPSDIVYSNIDISIAARIFKKALGWSLSVISIFVWVVISVMVCLVFNPKILEMAVFIDVKENLKNLFNYVSFAVPGLILFSIIHFLPDLFEFLSKLKGNCIKSEVETHIMINYSAFLINILLGTTFANDLSFKIYTKMFSENITTIINTIATPLPTAYPYFLVYLILCSFLYAPQYIFQLVRYILLLLGWISFGLSPRRRLGHYKPEAARYSTLWAETIFVFCIGVLYSVISPIISIFVALYFFIFSQAYKYQFIYVFDVKKHDCQGNLFVKAVDFMFFGVYLSELTYISLVQVDIVHFSLSILLVILTISAHFVVYRTHIKRIDLVCALETSNLPSEATQESIDYHKYFTHPLLLNPGMKLWIPNCSKFSFIKELIEKADTKGVGIEVVHNGTCFVNNSLKFGGLDFPENVLVQDSII